MAPLRQALAQSESKARFFERLGLDERNEFHRRVYSMMKEEAVEGRRRMTESQDVLVPALRGNASVGPPYSNAQISETVTHREILRIYRMARPETRVIYDLGQDLDRVEEENWVIRWMLWHVFRYRDSRNKNRRPTSPSPERARCYQQPASIPSIAPTTASRCSTSTSSHRQSYYWDPVRGTWCSR